MGIRLGTRLLALTAVTLAVVSARAQAPHASGDATDSTVNVCDDVAGALCPTYGVKDSDTQAKVLASSLKERLKKVFASLHGGQPEALIQKQLEADGLRFKPDADPENRKRVLLPVSLLNPSAATIDYANVIDQNLPKCKAPASIKPAALQIDIEQFRRDLKHFLTLERPTNYGALSASEPTSFRKDVQARALAYQQELMDSPQGKAVAEAADNWDRSLADKTKLYDALMAYQDVERHAEMDFNQASFKEVEPNVGDIVQYEQYCQAYAALLGKITARDFSSSVSQYPTGADGNPVTCLYGDLWDQVTVSSHSVLTFPREDSAVKFQTAHFRQMLSETLSRLSAKDRADFIKGYLKGATKNGAAFLKKLPAGSSDGGADVDNLLAVWLESIDQSAKKKSDLDAIKEELSPADDELKSLWETLCQTREEVIKARIDSVGNRLVKNLSLSRPVVEAVTSFFYTPEHIASAEREFNEVKAAITEVVAEKLLPAVSSAPKRKLMQDTFADLKLYLPQDPSTLKYLHSKEYGFDYLDMDALSPDEVHYQTFENPSLKDFTEVNAFYTPEHRTGLEVSNKKFVMLPGLSLMFKDHPLTIEQIMAHEMGHHFGPEISKINGYDLRSTLEPMMKCFKGKDSIRVRDDQRDECFADWMSAEALAKLIQKFPASERKAKTETMFAAFCTFFRDHYFNGEHDVHPNSLRRINGVLGAQPEIRKALGCQNAGPFKYCDMSGGAAK